MYIVVKVLWGDEDKLFIKVTSACVLELDKRGLCGHNHDNVGMHTLHTFLIESFIKSDTIMHER